VRLVATAAPARLADDGLFAPAALAGPVEAEGAAPADGLAAPATVSPSVTVDVVAPAGGADVRFSASVAIYEADGATLAARSAAPVAGAGAPGAAVTLALPPLALARAHLWSVARPYLYVVVATLLDARGAPVDAVNATLGVREVRFDADAGAFLNGQHLKLRGFCNHASFAAVGMGVPDRINLFRLQQIRGMGGNSWRMSHNPGTPATFALADALGMTVLDENRVFDGKPQSVVNMGDMVRRDRQHPSILYWSFCNEAGVSGGGGGGGGGARARARAPRPPPPPPPPPLPPPAGPPPPPPLSHVSPSLTYLSLLSPSPLSLCVYSGHLGSPFREPGGTNAP